MGTDCMQSAMCSTRNRRWFQIKPEENLDGGEVRGLRKQKATEKIASHSKDRKKKGLIARTRHFEPFLISEHRPFFITPTSIIIVFFYFF